MLTCKKNRRRGGSRAFRRGFTLIEALIATFMVGLGVSAMMVATKSGTQVNAEARDITQAVYLWQEVREWTLKLPFKDPDTPEEYPGPDTGEDPQVFVDDIDDLMYVTYDPPRDGTGQAASDMTGWSQQISLRWCDPNCIAATVSPGTSDLIYVEVTILYEGQSVLKAGWLVTKKD